MADFLALLKSALADRYTIVQASVNDAGGAIKWPAGGNSLQSAIPAQAMRADGRGGGHPQRG
jgi:hypothetical protein